MKVLEDKPGRPMREAEVARFWLAQAEKHLHKEGSQSVTDRHRLNQAI